MSPEILLKQDFLTEEEFAIMRKHTEYGSTIIRRSLASPMSATSSSPIMNDTMVTARMYRHGAQPDMAAAEVARCTGSQFDPVVVEAFLATTHFRGGRHGEKSTAQRE
jgi:HD-GYP domain-containing protein (c-di-GMP phosphodiesterase class II)